LLDIEDKQHATVIDALDLHNMCNKCYIKFMLRQYSNEM